MGWSLTDSVPRESELLDEVFLAVGKALFIATEFERKCRLLLRILKFLDFAKESGDASAALELANRLRERMLGQIVPELGQYFEVAAEDLRSLEQARDARNFIAHESAGIGVLSGVSAKYFDERLEHLREQVRALANGDNLVSRWWYEIEEKRPAPYRIQEAYPRWIEQWIFGDCTDDADI
jgi:hypothetical protein